MNAQQELENIKRLLRNLIRTGTVQDANGQLVRVKIGNLLTNWLPWCNMRAGSVRVYSTPSKGEQCMVFAPGGNLNEGVVLTGIYSNIIAPPEGGENDLIMEVPADGRMVLRCGETSIELTADNLKHTSQRIDLN